MKILIFSDPWIEVERSNLKTAWSAVYFKPLIKTILSGEIAKKEDIFVIFGDPQEDEYLEFLADNGIKYSVICQKELHQTFSNSEAYYENYYTEKVSEENMLKAIKFYSKHLSDFKPDFIFPFSCPVPFFRNLFPEAAVFMTESGFSTRAPFPPSFYIDPFGDIRNTYISQNAKRINNSPLSLDEKKWLESFRKFFVDELIKPADPFEEIFRNMKFKKYLLLPLQYSHHFLFDRACTFKTQWEYLMYVLINTPEDIGVIVTEHPGADYTGILSSNRLSNNLEYLRSKFKNFIYDNSFCKVESPSTYIISRADYVVTVGSSVSFLALLFQKQVFSIGSSFIGSFSCAFSRDNLENPRARNNDPLLYFLLTRYFPLLEQNLLNPEWLKNFLQKHKKKMDNPTEYYDLLAEPEQILDLYIKNAKTNLPIWLRPEYNPNYKEPEPPPEQSEPTLLMCLRSLIRVLIGSRLTSLVRKLIFRREQVTPDS